MPDRPTPSKRPSNSQPAPRRRDGIRRSAIIGLILAVLLLGGLIDKTAAHTRTVPAPAVLPVPVAAPARALSSSWFCAGATGDGNGFAPGSVIIANSAPTAATGTVTIVANNKAKTVVPVGIGPFSRVSVPEALPGGAPWVGAIVDMNAGAVAVSQQIDGQLGRASNPCATTGSSQWYFTSGATLVNAGVVMSLLNPYPTDAVISLAFTTDQGTESPQEYQALDVPPGGLIAINIGDHLRRRHAIATTVTSSSGRIVAWKTDVVYPPRSGAVLVGTPQAQNPLADPAAPVPGVTLTLGAPAPATIWMWGAGNAGNGINEQYVIYNPGSTAARLKLSIALDAGVAEPFDITVAPGLVETIVSDQEVRIPPGVGHAAVLQSVNRVPVIAERTIQAASPSGRSGLGEILGGRVVADGWLVPAGRADASHDGFIEILNAGTTSARAVVYALDSKGQASVKSVAIGPGRRSEIHLNGIFSTFDWPILVQSSEPVYVEVGFYGKGSTPGVNLSGAVPLSP